MFLICYDIQNNSLRTRISDKLIESGLHRIQYSVFLGNLKSAIHQDLLKWLHTNIQKGNPQKDSVIVVRLGLEEVRKMTVIGTTQLDTDEITGDKNTLFF
jgi:CRISPR-associated endonuclease Cas2